MKALAHDWVWGATSHRTRDAECRCGVEVQTPNKTRRTVSYRDAGGTKADKLPPCTRGDDEPATPAELAAVGEE